MPVIKSGEQSDSRRRPDPTSVQASSPYQHIITSHTRAFESEEQQRPRLDTPDEQSERSSHGLRLSQGNLPTPVSGTGPHKEHGIQTAQRLPPEAYSMPLVMDPEAILQEDLAFACPTSSQQGAQSQEMSELTFVGHERLPRQLLTPCFSSTSQSGSEYQRNWHSMPSVIQSVDDIDHSQQLLHSMPLLMQPEQDENSEQFMQRFMLSLDSWDEGLMTQSRGSQRPGMLCREADRPSGGLTSDFSTSRFETQRMR